MLLLPIGLMAQPAVAATAPLLLDSITASVKGAYALRTLRAAYAGPAVRVRRASDSAEQDIGFAAGALDTAALLAFCGAGDGFVTKWYDQSGLGQDMAQAVAAQQPRIVVAGVVHTLGGAAGARASLGFASASQRFLSNAVFALGGAQFASCSVARRIASTVGYPRLLGYATAGQEDYSSLASAVFAYFQGGILGGYQGGQKSQAALGTNPFQVASVFDGTNHTLTLDGVASASVAANGTLSATGTLSFALGDAGSYWDGEHAEHIIVAGALTTADQAAIRASQQGFYGTP